MFGQAFDELHFFDRSILRIGYTPIRSSGAGKSTLMDVLAGRKTGDKITGKHSTQWTSSESTSEHSKHSDTIAVVGFA